MIAQLPNYFANEARHQKAYLLIQIKGLAPISEPPLRKYLRKVLQNFQTARILMNEITNPTERNNKQTTYIEAEIQKREKELKPQEVSQSAQEQFKKLGIALKPQEDGSMSIQGVT